MSLCIGSLFSGYGGLDLAVAAHYGASVAWHVEYDAAPSKILAHHWPDVPNYGDVTGVDFGAVEPVDILTAGYPCQPFSHAGNRKGTDDERHLWPHVLRVIGEMGPRLAILENVRGHLTLGFDVSSLTLPTWGGLHRGVLCEHPTPEPATNGLDYSSLPTPTAQAAKHGETPDLTAASFGSNLWDLPHLLPTPAVNDMGRGKTVEWWDEWAPRQQASDGRPAAHGKSLEIEALRIGDHTVPPSPGGNTSPDGPHPNQHNQDETASHDYLPGLWNG